MNTLYIIHCSSWEPKAPFDDSLVGFTTKEEAEDWKAKTAKWCSGTHTVVTVIPE